MTKLEVWPLETDGFAIVSALRAEQLRDQFEPHQDIEATAQWGDFRAAGHPFELASEIIDRAAGIDVLDYIAAVEAANGLDDSAMSAEDRWGRACALANGPLPDSDAPNDGDDFSYQYGEYGATFGWSLALQAWMLHDVPQDVLDEFGLAYGSTLDGSLGLVPFEQLDDVRNHLVGLGFEVE
jgi:hypothetical protein